MASGRWNQCLASTVCQLSVLVAAAAYSWFEPITLRLTQDPQFGFTADEVSWIMSIVEAGCLISPIISAYLSDRFGRKPVILTIGPLTFFGWLLVMSSTSFFSLCLCRVLHGMAFGVALTIPPIYSAEIAEPQLRGTLCGTFQTIRYLGALIVFSIGPYLSYKNYAYCCLPIPVLFMVMFLLFPETPYSLLMRGREEEARKSLRWFRGTEDAEEELANMKVAVKENATYKKNAWKILFGDKIERKAFIIVQIVMTAKILTGIPIIINYAVETFSKSESFLPPEEMSIALMGLLTGIAVVSAFLSDWIGRKPLVVVSCFGCFLSNLLIGSYYFLHEKTSVEARPYAWMLYAGMAFYCFFVDVGLAPLLLTLQGEMFGSQTRGLAGGITEAYGSVLAFLTIKAYSPISRDIGIYIIFWFFALVGLVCGAFLLWLMYETKGTTIGARNEKYDQVDREEKGAELEASSLILS